MPENEDVNQMETVFCPRCNRAIDDTHIKVSDEVMQDYTRCLLGQRSFSRTIKLLDGNLSLEFVALSAEQAELILAQAKNLSLERILDLKMLATLARIQLVDPVLHEVVDAYTASYEDRLAHCKKVPESVSSVLKDIDAPLLGIVRKCALSFDVLCTAIKERVFDEDFYEGIGLL